MLNMQPILQDASVELRGERIVLKRPDTGDGARVYEAVLESLPELRAWPASLPWSLHEPSVESSEIFCRTSCAESIMRTRLSYLVLDAETSAVIGCMGVPRLDWEVPKFEIGFWCRTSCHGKGFMTDALKTLISYLQKTHGARRIDCWTDEQNRKARALCDRAGMTHEATIHNERITPAGELRHSVVYAIVT
jgi:RimJ/RimL family protein N-acetyltransferase